MKSYRSLSPHGFATPNPRLTAFSMKASSAASPFFFVPCCARHTRPAPPWFSSPKNTNGAGPEACANLFTLYFKHSKLDGVNGDMSPKFISGLQSAACREIHSFYGKYPFRTRCYSEDAMTGTDYLTGNLPNSNALS